MSLQRGYLGGFPGSLHVGSHTGDMAFKEVSAPGNYTTLLVEGRDVIPLLWVLGLLVANSFFQESISHGQTRLAGHPDANTAILSFQW